MGWYANQIEPRLIEFACGLKPIQEQRDQTVHMARGTVLEVGFGSGLNLPFYSASRVDKLFSLEPSQAMRKRACKRAAAVRFEVEYLECPGEQIPLEDESIDTVVITYAMCTIPGIQEALQGIRRVLKPGGQMIFCEHGLAPDSRVAKWQKFLTPTWKHIAGGCHMNRDIPELIRQGGFDILWMKEGYLKRVPRMLGYNYCGVAVVGDGSVL